MPAHRRWTNLPDQRPHAGINSLQLLINLSIAEARGLGKCVGALSGVGDLPDHGAHQGRWCFGKTPMQTFLDSADQAREKQKSGKRRTAEAANSFDPADTRHARSSESQIKVDTSAGQKAYFREDRFSGGRPDAFCATFISSARSASSSSSQIQGSSSGGAKLGGTATGDFISGAEYCSSDGETSGIHAEGAGWPCERVKIHNEDSGFCVLRVKTRG